MFEELRSRNPDFPGGHKGAARSAEKLDHWGIAAEAWAAASRLAPGRKALAGHAAALLKLEGWRKPKRLLASCANVFRRKSPDIGAWSGSLPNAATGHSHCKCRMSYGRH